MLKSGFSDADTNNEIHFKEDQKLDLANCIKEFLQKNDGMLTVLITVCFFYNFINNN